MIVVSCRQGFGSDCKLAGRLLVREYPDLARLDEYRSVGLSELRARAAGQTVGVLVHGYNTKLSEVLTAYGEMQERMTQAGLLGRQGCYGLLVGFAWPGWTRVAFLLARRAANQAGLFLRELMNELRGTAQAVDVQTHSLGARVALSALRKKDGTAARHVLLSAAAVDYAILEPGRFFQPSLRACARCVVYHSRRDKVLRQAFPVGDSPDGIQPALGLNGPRSRAITLKACPNVHVVDCAAVVGEHSGYRKADAYYQHWHRVASGAALERYEKL